MKYPVFAMLIIVSVSNLYSQNKSPLPFDTSGSIEAEKINQYLEKYLVPFFKKHGFVLSINEFGYEISKNVGHIKYTCTCSKLKRSPGIYFEPLSMEVWFEEIENPLKELLLKYNLDQSPHTLRDYNNNESAIKKETTSFGDYNSYGVRLCSL